MLTLVKLYVERVHKRRVKDSAEELCGTSFSKSLVTLLTGSLDAFPNRESCLRLVTALAIEQSKEWMTGGRYLDMRELEQHRC